MNQLSNIKIWVFSLLVLLGAASAATVAAVLITQVVTRQAEIQFENQTQIVHSLIERRVESYIDGLYGIRGLFAASETIERAEFFDYIQNLNVAQHYPGISGISFTEHLTPATTAPYVSRIRNEGYPNFDIHPAGERADYYVITYIEPFNPDSSAFGFDLSTSPERLEAIERARDTGLLSTTAPLDLLNSGKNGFIIFMPLYLPGAAVDTLDQRRENFIGTVNAVIDANALFAPLLEDLADRQLQITVQDVHATDARLYRSANLVTATDTITQQRTIDIGGRTWNINYQAERYYHVTRADWFLYWTCIVLCYLFSIFVFFMTYLVLTSQSRARSIAQEMLVKQQMQELSSKKRLQS